MIELIWLIPLIPLIGFLINGLGQKVLSKTLIGIIGSGVVLASFLLSCVLFGMVMDARDAGGDGVFTYQLFEWIAVGDFKLNFSFLLDPLSSLMLLIITGIGFLIHLYSISYMSHETGFGKFFAYLNLFIFFMLLLVLGSNYLIMFIGWEGVGLCSYLLIGFWYKNSNYASAAKKAFVMNRIGDLGFLIAVFAIIAAFGSLEYATVFQSASTLPLGDTTLLLITLLLFVAATGKSAQIPLFTWLPDAMAGPTPVSALIHAATMVTAGIYMIVRSNILFTLSPITMQIIAIIGVLTALVAAFIALTQNDIKKVLAYSTVSQLGYMFLALGVGAFTGAFFHVITHAFFKALLFLGAGSVIHGMSDEQDMRKMGGLKSKMPITFVTMLIGTIAISGIPPLSGFFSKDEILAFAFVSNPLLWGLGFLTALCTSFYMFRLLFLTFYGKFRGTEDQKHHVHESPWHMTFPLIVLAILATIGGALNIPEALHGGHWLANFLSPIYTYSNAIVEPTLVDHSTEYILMGISAVAAVIMAVAAYIKYVQKQRIPGDDKVQHGLLHKLSYHKLYIDEIYNALIVKPLNGLSRLLYTFLDRAVIDGFVNGVGSFIESSGRGIRQLQSGYVGFYIFMMVIGVIAILLYGFLNI
ncbi:NADH-quinone oxidoreductase subunit L [Sphingobacterium rhinopitheci]|uniref:NADH-quinone oxidoreductase subunit L n=1 Tax=Sphingobacterium rhinopitheci TaxID=2781960 RepID=UPI001F51BD48|nr:NADH-quinone oxidoreductase subunit L [Sphingobacterium rhinopitheci]MCI0920593.1 NADH-quinone oxidoreductase subunit L [Sphingobacterium rhinopitheci]